MPPIRTPKGPAAPKSGTSTPRNPARPTAGAKPESPTGSSSGSRSNRKTNRDLLKDRLERFYIMIGTICVPFARFFPALEPIGQNLKTFSSEATDAWLELADSDPKVKSYLESITGASTWGNVIGIHFAIFATAIPANSITSAFAGGGTDDPIAMARAMGLSEEEIAQAVAMGEKLGGGPGDTIKSDRSPADAVPEKAVRSNGIQTPVDLGVTQPGSHDIPMPADGGPLNG